MFTLGSLFDGIGGWLLAATRNGVKLVWSSEIEEFPMRVSKAHFPDVEQLGDVTKIDGGKVTPVDIICAGSPCQDLSVAGKRKGLAGSRSNLFFESVRIAREMREKTNGLYPKFFVWENVPGAFSSNHGHDFQAVLSEIGQTGVPMPRNGKWAPAGLARLPKCDIAWRTLDAQFWGVPQRRRRIFLIADFAEKKQMCRRSVICRAERARGYCGEQNGAGRSCRRRWRRRSSVKLVHSWECNQSERQERRSSSRRR